jgi:N-methylhydantoinase A
VVADLRHDYVNTVNRAVPALDMQQVKEILESQVAEGHALLEREGVAIEGTRLLFSADMQFQGQSHILTVRLPGPEVTREELQKLFDRAYWDRFGVELPEIRAMLVNLHTAVIGERPPLDLRVLHDRGAPSAPRNRRVFFDGAWLDTRVYERSSLPAEIQGPAILEQLDCTTVLEPGNRAHVDALGNLNVEVQATSG